MKKDNIKKRIDGLNEYMLSDSNLQLLLLCKGKNTNFEEQER